MAWLLPFKAGYYNPQKIARIEDCISSPYDELETGELNQLQKNPYHYSHVIRTVPGDNESYVTAKHKLFGWFIRDVILFDKVASLYVYEQSFISQGTVQRRYGIFARVAVEDLAKRLRLHEETIEEYVEDSYQRIAVSQCHLEPLLVGYHNPSLKIADNVSQNLSLPPLISFGGSSENEHRIYQVSEPAVIDRLASALQGEKLFLLDGHHRFMAALRYQEEQKMAKGSAYTGEEPWNYVLIALVNMADEGFTPLPWNRLIKTLPLSAQDLMKQMGTVFKLAAIPFQDAMTEKAARKKLRLLLSEYASKKVSAFGVALSQASTKYFLAVGGQGFSPLVVDEQVIRKILGMNPRYPDVHYESQDQRAFERVKNKQYQVAFFTQTISLLDFVQLPSNQIFMPRAFDFYPKVPSGVILYSFKYSV
ncbi:DUF1015 domain-containing protein [Thermospira aquatica]|uniref:DUF1015 domain-containing protein n=1 Tax=Thermospira aquatica TaxID=2828656 RepID=A0AAX3BAT0_9SPIR|nr:DUF1015 domain-containing protein [Thermospira aquatica]URA09353.1 DUF1015 domain-containing protein [Thermospira aquatica]